MDEIQAKMEHVSARPRPLLQQAKVIWVSISGWGVLAPNMPFTSYNCQSVIFIEGAYDSEHSEDVKLFVLSMNAIEVFSHWNRG